MVQLSSEAFYVHFSLLMAGCTRQEADLPSVIDLFYIAYNYYYVHLYRFLCCMLYILVVYHRDSRYGSPPWLLPQRTRSILRSITILHNYLQWKQSIVQEYTKYNRVIGRFMRRILNMRD